MTIRMGMAIRRPRRAAEVEVGIARNRLTGTIVIQHPHSPTHRTRNRQRASRALVRPDRGQWPRAPEALLLLSRVLLVRPREASITATRGSANIPHRQPGLRITGKSVRVVGAAKMMRTLMPMDMRGKEDRLVEISPLPPPLLLLGLQLLLVVIITATTTPLLPFQPPAQLAIISPCPNRGNEVGMIWRWRVIMT